MHAKLTSLSARAVVQAYATGQTDPVAVAKAYLDRIRERNPGVHAFIHICEDLALEQAQESALRWARRQPLGPLDGIMLSLKDNIDVVGMPCTAGTAAFANRLPSQDAHLYSRLQAAGMVLVGKCNMHEAAMGATTDNAVYGRCMNPLREHFTPGGSSGGSAVAVADDLCHVSIGTDTLGSVRIPAAYCGVMGFIPTRGRLSMSGIIPLSPSLDAAGPLARCGYDLAQVMCQLLDTPPPISTGRDIWHSLRIGILSQVDEIEMSSDVRRAWQTTQQTLENRGAVLRQIAHPQKSLASVRLNAFLLSEWEGADYWYGTLGPQLLGLTTGLQKIFRYGAGIPPEKRKSVLAALDDIRAQSDDMFAEVDVILLPTTSDTAFNHDHAAPPHQADFTCLANILGAPALSFPVPTDGLPVSCQFLAAPNQDEQLLSIAIALDEFWN
jgi:aspartyl-tRNA(Asn)/glutamyl-tRNA(Gln) amidotransferase subunit A